MEHFLLCGEDIFHKRVYLLLPRIKGGSESPSCTFWFYFKCWWLKINFMLKRHMLEWIYWFPTVLTFHDPLSVFYSPNPKGELCFPLPSGPRDTVSALGGSSGHKIQAWPTTMNGMGMARLGQPERFFGTHMWMPGKKALSSKSNTLKCCSLTTQKGK